MNSDTPYARLSPDTILDAVEMLGYRVDGHLLALNSYENRVYQVGVENRSPVVVKFYRPARWSDAAIEEEHVFALDLAAAELPVVAPERIGGATLHRFGGFRFALWPRRGGREPELDADDTLVRIGRLIARIHNVGAQRQFTHRPTLTIERFGQDAVHWLGASAWLPADLAPAYATVAMHALDEIGACFARAGATPSIRLHGDCHRGNIFWTDSGAHFVDLDDARAGPALQDLWMLLAGDRDAMTRQLSRVLEGYESFRPFNRRELHLLEALRTLRLIHHAAWLARRWNDPAFPAAFPWFAQPRFWQDHILALREQIAAMQEGPLPCA